MLNFVNALLLAISPASACAPLHSPPSPSPLHLYPDFSFAHSSWFFRPNRRCFADWSPLPPFSPPGGWRLPLQTWMGLALLTFRSHVIILLTIMTTGLQCFLLSELFRAFVASTRNKLNAHESGLPDTRFSVPSQSPLLQSELGRMTHISPFMGIINQITCYSDLGSFKFILVG